MSECVYCKNTFEMEETCADEFRMWQGLQGPYYIPAVDDLGNLSWTNTGSLPNPDPVNITGKGMNIVGIVDDVSDLPESAEDFDAYLVGEENPFTAYMWDGSAWVDLGEVGRGPQGEPGEGIPAGGTTGQVLVKASGTDYDTEWADPSGGDLTELMNFRGTIVTPEDYASPGDADDTNAIQSAVTAAGAGGTVVFRGDKTYTISSTITINRPNVKLISLSSTMHTPVIKAVNFTDSVMFSVVNTSVQFENLTIEGDYTTTGIQIKLADSLGDQRVNMDAKVLQCYIRNQALGIQAYGRNCFIKDSNFSGCKNGVDFQFLPDLTGEDNLPARGWIVDSCRFHGMGYHWFPDSGNDLPAFSNFDTLKTFDYWCIKTPASTSTSQNSRCISIIVRGNFADLCYSGFYYGSMECLELANNLLTRDNYNSILCIGLGGVYGDSGMIRDNVVLGRIRSNITETIGNVCPIYLTGSASAEIRNNTFLDYSRWGVYIDSAASTKIIGNVFDGVAYNDTVTEAVRNVSSTNNVLLNNFFNRKKSTGTAPSLVNSTTGLLVDASGENSLINITNNFAQRFVVESYTTTYSIAANGAQTVSLGDFDVPQTKTGYTKAAILKLTSGDTGVLIRGYDISVLTGGGAYFVNTTGSAKNNLTANLTVLWIKNN